MFGCVCTYAYIRSYEHKEVSGKVHIKLLTWIIWAGVTNMDGRRRVGGAVKQIKGMKMTVQLLKKETPLVH